MSAVEHDPCRLRESLGSDGARLTSYTHGGHVAGWWPAGETESRLWMSPTTGCAPGVAIRGGIPVVFPQFGTLGSLRKHGFVRDVPWTRVEGADRAAATDLAEAAQGAAARPAVVSVETPVGPTDDWPHEATLRLTARASGHRLDVHLEVRNTGSSSLSFTAALHTYLSVGEPGSTVSGLGGLLATDAMAGGLSLSLPDALPTDAAMDLLVHAVGDRPVTVGSPTRPGVALTALGFPDRVVWNPGAGHTLPDVPAGDEAGFVCVEPAVLEPIVLEPAQRWDGIMTLRSLAPTNPPA